MVPPLHEGPSPTPSPDVLHVTLGAGCNNRCTFCMEYGRGGGHTLTPDELGAQLDSFADRTNMVTFTGGEPTLQRMLVPAVAAARARGYRRIGLVSNGRRLADRALCEALLAAGLTEITVSCHGPDASVHDAISRREGAFDELAAGLTNLAALRPEWPHSLSGNCTLVRANLPHMRATAEGLWRAGATSVNFNAVEPRGRADDDFDAVVPNYSEILDAADASGLDFSMPDCSLSRVPPCAGGPDWVQEVWNISHSGSFQRYEPSFGRVRGEPCGRCSARESCPGLWERYARTHGWARLTPVEAPRDAEVLALGADASAAELRRGALRGFRRLDLQISGADLVATERGSPVAERVRRGRAAGFSEITLTLSARTIRHPGEAAAVSAVGADRLVVPLHAATPHRHDRVVGEKGAFAEEIRGIARLRARGVSVTVRLPDRDAPGALRLALALGLAVE